MFRHIALISFLALSVSASPISSISASQCNTGSVQCCNSMTSAGDSPTELYSVLSALFQIDTDTPLGLTCNPLSGIGDGATWYVTYPKLISPCSLNSWHDSESAPVCCENNYNTGAGMWFPDIPALTTYPDIQ